ncbi:uncharacterized protein LOC110373903 isoform X3 [Helicoverpa armigera]|uniref:uncharacterized protein LOC110373903 isoform X3 n=1 Tax=Helicoverpa armigera TaxID=29058 RepID=UPI0030835FEF
MNEITEKKRTPRSKNWETKEKVLLREIIKSYLGILNNKSLETATNEAKKRAWVEITKKFNSICYKRKRTTQQIRIQWKKMKMLIKKQMSAAGKRSEQSDSGLEILETQETTDNIIDLENLKVESVIYDTDCEEVTNPLEDSNPVTETVITSKPTRQETPNIEVEFEVLDACSSSTQTDHDYVTLLKNNKFLQYTIKSIFLKITTKT